MQHSTQDPPPLSVDELGRLDDDSIIIEPHKNGHRLQAFTRIPRPINEVFEFFSIPQNLGRITPPSMRFQLLPGSDASTFEGAHFHYRIGLHGVPMPWTSRIEVYESPSRFVDTQIRGPYRRWWHEHLFRELHDGTTGMWDVVDFVAPAHRLTSALVMRDVRRIFEYRATAIADLFAGDAPPNLQAGGASA